MISVYDKYYQTEHLFGEIYEKLYSFFKNYHKKGKVLDIGCGQGRNAIPLARIGYSITGVDISEIGINQMNKVTQKENLPIEGILSDIYEINNFNKYDFILIDNFLHFDKNNISNESKFLSKIIEKINTGCLIIFCLPVKERNLNILHEIIGSNLETIKEEEFQYAFEGSEVGNKTNYKMIVAKK